MDILWFIFKDNNILIVPPQTFFGLPRLDTLDLSQNKLDDESFNQNSLFVSFTVVLLFLCQGSKSTSVFKKYWASQMFIYF